MNRIYVEDKNKSEGVHEKNAHYAYCNNAYTITFYLSISITIITGALYYL